MAVNGHSRGRVLVGFAESLAAPEATWSLLEAGFEVVAFQRRGSRPALRHCRGVTLEAITAPEAATAAAIEDLAGLIERLGPLATMPLDDASVWLLDRLGDAVATPIAGPTGERAGLALDRSRQMEAARAAGFDVPRTRAFATPAAAAGVSDFPLAVRPARVVDERHGRLVRRTTRPCGDRLELQSALDAYGPDEQVLLQPLLRGVGEGIFGVRHQGGLAAVSAHRRVRMMNPAGSGSSACVSIGVDTEPRAAAERMLEAADWQGAFMIELLREPSGRCRFIELNGRVWGSIALARRTGFEYPAWGLQQALDPAFVPPDPTPHPGVVCRHAGRELVHLAHVLRGPRSRALADDWPSRGHAARDVLSIHRGERWYNWRPQERRLFAADTIETVRTALGRGPRG